MGVLLDTRGEGVMSWAVDGRELPFRLRGVADLVHDQMQVCVEGAARTTYRVVETPAAPVRCAEATVRWSDYSTSPRY